MVSGHPYITGSSVNSGGEVKIEFPFVTKNIKIRIPSPPNTALDNSTGNKRLRTAPQGAGNTTAGVYNLGAGNDFTVAFWFKRQSNNFQAFDLGKNGGRVVQLRRAAMNPAEYQWYGISGLQTVGIGDAAADWHHVVLTQHTGSVHFYLDGNVDVAAGASPDWDDLIFPPNTGQAEFIKIDEITVWNDGFDYSEYLELYNSGEWYNPNIHSKKANLLTWHTMGDAAADRVNSDPAINDLAGTNEPLDLRAAGTAGVFVSGPFTSQTTGKLRVSLLSTGSASGANIVSNKHYQEIQGYGTSIDLPMKTKEIYIQGVDAQVTFEVIAELTNIPAERMYALTGSGIDD